jgi:taurine dioxygenase
MQFETIQVAPCTLRIGAEVRGIDLSQALNAIQIAELNAALVEYQVLFFRDQPLDLDSQERAGRYFGELIRHSGVAGVDGHPEVVAIHADENSQYVAGEEWHSDLSCDAEPPLGSLLYLHTVPPVGGDTMFSSMYAAYDALSERMKQYLDGMTAVHDGEHVYRRFTSDASKRFPVNSHPVVRTHPVSGRKALFANAQYVTHINGLPKEESDAVLSFLAKHCMNAAFHVRFRWQPHSVALWDNRCVEHYAIWDYFPQKRSGYRVTIKGDKPF